MIQHSTLRSSFLCFVVAFTWMSYSPPAAAATGDLLQTLRSPFPGAETAFGASVAIHGDRILVGNPRQNAIGAAHLYDAATGELIHTFMSPAAHSNDRFGYRLAFVGDDIIVSDMTATQDVVRRFDGTTFELLQTWESPLGPDSDASFGSAVVSVASNNQIAIGELGVQVPGLADRRGAIHLYNAATNEFLRTITNPDAPIVGGPGDTRFGSVLAAGDGFLVAGNELHREPERPDYIRGIAYVFDAASGDLMHSLRLPPEFDLYFHEQLGSRVAADGNLVAVSEHAWTFLFDATSGDLVNIFQRPTFASEIDSLALLGDVAFTGSSNSGDVFAMQGPTCCLPVLALSGDNSGFGRSVALDGRVLVIGDFGAVHVFESVVPEPNSIALGAGAMLVAFMFYRRRR